MMTQRETPTGYGRILIVDDDESICKSLALILGKKGYNVETAATGREALDKAQECAFNIALLDIRLPDMEGVDLLSPLKKLHPDMVIFIITGYASVKTAMRALNNGASGYLTKPIDVDDLLTKIKDNIEMQKLKEENLDLYDALQRELTERKKAEQEISRRNRELVLLNQIIAASAANPDPASILHTACSELATAFDVPHAAAFLLNEKRAQATLMAEYRVEDHPSLLKTDISMASTNRLTRYILARRTPLAVADVKNDERLASVKDSLRLDDTASMLVLPLTINQEVVGLLMLGTSEPRQFSAEEINLGWSVSDQVSGALGQARLIQAHQRLFTAIEQTADSVAVTDTTGTILYVNPAFERVSGYRADEVIGQNPRILKSGQQLPEVYENLWRTITRGEDWQGRLVNKRKDGTLFTEDVTISPVRDGNNNIVNYVSVKRNITRELELEEQYRQAQKMETIGRLTGGIAHDFNNLLTAVVGFAELTQMRLAPDDPIQKMVDKILYSGRRAADLVGQLMTFSRKQVIELKVFNLNDIVADFEKMLRRIIGEDTEMETRLSPDLWPIKADRTQIEQIIVNLAVNARDAMPNGGRLTIETANVVLDERYEATHLDAKTGPYVLLQVSDTGIGMSKEIQNRIFEPFFTTKKQGKGSGLGLSTIFGIIQQYQGHIWVESEENVGSIFKVYIPRCEETRTSMLPSEQPDDIPRGKETILLVEDEPAVREMAAFTLRQQGYTVWEASNGQEALQLAQSTTDDIHLLLTDVVMPQMNGKDLADQIKAIRPNTKALFASGYTDEAIVQHGVLKPGIAFLPKPFSPSALSQKVRQTLDEDSP